jgi:uncharacterized membrane protein YphA (DoxX/SURF4 family)
MAAATLVARLVLAAIFAVAGAAKLAERDDARRTLRGFEVPDAVVAPLALLVPIAELATAGALCWQLLRQNGRLWKALHELERRFGTEVSA